jgi:pyruvate formate lyase activating enzyme
VATCVICKRTGDDIAKILSLCKDCILEGSSEALGQSAAAHAASRGGFGLPIEPPRAPEGALCRICVNACRIPDGEVGYCGARENLDGELTGGDAEGAVVGMYHDSLPTNCVADWVCPASGGAGYPRFTDTKDPEYGRANLAVFYKACTFDCLFCQNWHYRRDSITGVKHPPSELAEAAGPTTRCICFFGGDPTAQVEHALAVAREARTLAADRILRICWETNGSVTRSYLDQMAEISLESGGCIKFDLKAFDDSLHRALCGTTNRQTHQNFRYLGEWVARRPDPPFLIASTLLVPGYVDAEQVGKIAALIAGIDPEIPYSLLGFHPDFEMSDLPPTSRRQAEDCAEAAARAGLKRLHIGNWHLLH